MNEKKKNKRIIKNMKVKKKKKMFRVNAEIRTKHDFVI